VAVAGYASTGRRALATADRVREILAVDAPRPAAKGTGRGSAVDGAAHPDTGGDTGTARDADTARDTGTDTDTGTARDADMEWDTGSAREAQARGTAMGGR
jgi:hypothetical protein